METVDPILICPYKSTHFIPASLMSIHVIACVKDYPSTGKLFCPFDALHMIEEKYYKMHIVNCASNSKARNSNCCLEMPRQSGIVPLESLKNLSVPQMEDWDEECVGTYDPLLATETRQVIRYLFMASKSKRKEFRWSERKRWQLFKQESKHNSELSRIEPYEPSIRKCEDFQNDSNLIMKMRNLNIQNLDLIIDNIDLNKLHISSSYYKLKKRECFSEIIENSLAKELKELEIQNLIKEEYPSAMVEQVKEIVAKMQELGLRCSKKRNLKKNKKARRGDCKY